MPQLCVCMCDQGSYCCSDGVVGCVLGFSSSDPGFESFNIRVCVCVLLMQDKTTEMNKGAGDKNRVLHTQKVICGRVSATADCSTALGWSKSCCEHSYRAMCMHVSEMPDRQPATRQSRCPRVKKGNGELLCTRQGKRLKGRE